ncbi:MAG: hypothetical protein ACOVOV_03995, partial [Dolichospermum sp.]
LNSGACFNYSYNGGVEALPSTQTLVLNGAFGNTLFGATTGAGITFAGSSTGPYTSATISCNTTGSIGNNGALGGNIIGTGTITVGQTGYTSGSQYYRSNMSGFSGTINTQSGTLASQYFWIQSNGATWSSTNLDLSNGGTFFPQVSTSIASLKSTSASTSAVNIGSGLTLSIVGSSTTTFAGPIQGAGNLTVAGTTNLAITNAAATGIVGVNSGAFINGGTVQTASISYLNMNTGSTLVVNPITTSSVSKITTATFVTTTSFKVAVSGPLNAGTYTILTAPTHTGNPLPTVGTNLSGRTVSGFAWSGNNLTMTLL